MIGSKILYDEPPVAVAPSAIRLFGANTAIVLQQIHYWTYTKLQIKPAERSQRNWDEDGTGPWLWESAKEIEAQTGVLAPTVRRSLIDLVERGILICREPQGFNRTKAYRLNYEALDRENPDAPHCADRPMAVTRENADADRESPGDAQSADCTMHSANRDILKEEESSLQKDLFAPAVCDDLPPRQKRILDIAQRVWLEAGALHPDGKPMTPKRLEIIAGAMAWIDRSAEVIKPEQVANWATCNHPAKLSTRDPLFDALAEIEGRVWWKPIRERDGKLLGMVTKRLTQDFGATAEQVREKAERYKKRWPNIDIFATALEKHWELLDTPPPSDGPQVVEVMVNGKPELVLR